MDRSVRFERTGRTQRDDDPVPSIDSPVLIVDDDLDMREALLDTLSFEGHAAVAVADGPAALSWLRANPPPALVLLDWGMAPLNGGQVMAEVAKEPSWASIPFVLLTAAADAEAKARTAGFSGYLKKPLDLNDLFALVCRHRG
jgi:two-component system response regulator FlrC